MTTTYGTPDEDLTAFNLLQEYVKDMEVKYFLHHPRNPMDPSKQCKWPGFLRVQAVLADNTCVTCEQQGVGGIAKIVSRI
jgi:hypothetical protein